MATKHKTIEPAARFAAVVAQLAGDPSVTPARMFGSQGLKVDGKVFAMLVKGKLVVKLPKERLDELVQHDAAEAFDPGHGKAMKQWVQISGDGVDWIEIALASRAYVTALKKA